MSLDKKFGIPIDPNGGESKLENLNPPVTLQKLDQTTSALLIEYMNCCISGPIFATFIMEKLPLLWVINEGGEFLFAIEEYISDQDQTERLARIGTLPRIITDGENNVTWERIGHPSLLNGGKGRIGGELSIERGKWILKNKSGRYGIVIGRTKTHLEEVERLLGSFGIKVESRWINPQPREIRQ